MSTLHGTLDKCNGCAAFSQCEVGEHDVCGLCRSTDILNCYACGFTQCSFTTLLEGVDDLGGSNE